VVPVSNVRLVVPMAGVETPAVDTMVITISSPVPTFAETSFVPAS
jgi:hypothetical protein